MQRNTRVTSQSSSTSSFLSESFLSSSKRERTRSSILSLYTAFPLSEITLSEFEQSGSDRLSLLQFLEQQKLKKNGFAGRDPEFLSLFRAFSLRVGLWNDAHRDLLSHHVLRLAFCATEEQRRWFLSAECLLFRLRFENESEEAIASFLNDNDLENEVRLLDQEKFVQLKSKLLAVPSFDSNSFPQAKDFYCVPFEEALDLLKERKVYLDKGDAFVSRSNLVHILVARFRSSLAAALAAAARMRRSGSSAAANDMRLMPVLKALGQQSAVTAYSSTSVSGTITLSQLSAVLASQSMPLCMSAMYNELQRSHHLKHTGRVSFNLFLKGIGLSMSDALTFWRQSMSRKTNADKFEKEFAYNIRHGYGREGKRADYTPFACIKIIQTQSHGAKVTNAGDCSGCPFKTSSDRALKATLSQRGINGANAEEVVKLSRDQHYQVACQRVFAFTHNNQLPDGVGNHPNAYFDISQRLLREDATVKKEEESGNVTDLIEHASTSANVPVVDTLNED